MPNYVISVDTNDLISSLQPGGFSAGEPGMVEMMVRNSASESTQAPIPSYSPFKGKVRLEKLIGIHVGSVGIFK